MKKLWLILSSFIIVTLLPSPISAHSTEVQQYPDVEPGMQFAIIAYRTRDDLDTLFANSQKVLSYLDTEEGSSIFLALIRDDQRQKIVQAGFTPKIIDINTDLSRYNLLYNPLPEQSIGTLTSGGIGEVFPLSKHYVIYKAPSNTPLASIQGTGEYWVVPFADQIVPPPLRTALATAPTQPSIPFPTPTPIVVKRTVNYFPIILLPILCGTFLLLIRRPYPGYMSFHWKPGNHIFLAVTLMSLLAVILFIFQAVSTISQQKRASSFAVDIEEL